MNKYPANESVRSAINTHGVKYASNLLPWEETVKDLNEEFFELLQEYDNDSELIKKLLELAKQGLASYGETYCAWLDGKETYPEMTIRSAHRLISTAKATLNEARKRLGED